MAAPIFIIPGICMKNAGMSDDGNILFTGTKWAVAMKARNKTGGNMNDGTYTVEISMTGGTGKAYINSPVQLTVSGGQMTARLEWSSSNYDLMIVGGKEFFPVNESGDSVFEIPVYTLDEPLSVQAETVAMSEPHMIDYMITFDKPPLPVQGDLNIPLIAGCSALAVVAALGAVFVFIKIRKRKK